VLSFFFGIGLLKSCLFFLVPATLGGVLNVDGFDWVTASICYFANMFLNIHFAFFVSTIFSRPRLGAELYMLLSLAMSLFFFVAYDVDIATDRSLMLLLGFIFPQSTLMWAYISNGW